MKPQTIFEKILEFIFGPRYNCEEGKHKRGYTLESNGKIYLDDSKVPKEKWKCLDCKLTRYAIKSDQETTFEDFKKNHINITEQNKEYIYDRIKFLKTEVARLRNEEEKLFHQLREINEADMTLGKYVDLKINNKKF